LTTEVKNRKNPESYGKRINEFEEEGLELFK
jgi:hypothetical protein